MTNEEKIAKKFSAFRQKVRTVCYDGLAQVMGDTIDHSLNLHEQLESNPSEPRHTFHPHSAGTHGYAVLDAATGELVSGHNGDSDEGGAEERAQDIATQGNPGIKGTFVATTYHESPQGNPIIDINFEAKIQEFCKHLAASHLPLVIHSLTGRIKA